MDFCPNCQSDDPSLPNYSPSAVKMQSDDPTQPNYNPRAPKRVSSDATRVPGPYVDPYSKYDDFTGAPVKTRMAIAAASKPEDQLATAQSMGLKGAHMTPRGMAYIKDDGNPAYVDPSLLGRPTFPFVNTNARDYVGAVGTAPAKLGAMAGAAIGGVSALEAPPLIPVAGAAGAATGGVLGRSVQKNLNSVLGIPDAVNSQTADQTGQQIVDDARGGAYQEFGGQLLGRLVGKAATASGNMVSRVKDMKDMGFAPTLGQATGSRTIQGAENLVAQLPGGAGTMQRNAEATVNRMGEVQNRIAGRVADQQPLSSEGAGEVAQDAAFGAGRSYNAQRKGLRSAADAMLPSRYPVTNIQQWLKDKMLATARNPNSTGDMQGAIDLATGIVKDAKKNGNAYDMNALLNQRTSIGKVAKFSSPNAPPIPGQAHYGSLYDAVNADIDAAAASRGSDAVKAQDDADAFVQNYRDPRNPAGAKFFGKVEKAQDPEAALKLMTAGGKEYTKRVMSIRSQVGDDAYNQIAGTHYLNLGTGSDGQFSGQTFLRNYGSLSQGEKRALYGGALDPNIITSMDKFAGVVKALKGAETTANATPYLRGQGLKAAALIAGPIIGGTAASGHTTAAIIEAAIAALGPKAAATVMTSQPLISGLTGLAKAVSKTPAAFGSSVGRLAGLKLGSPDEEEARAALIKQLQATQGN